MSIIISRNGKEGRRLTPEVMRNEEYLQQYVRDNPEILPLDAIGDDIRLLVLAREFPTASGPADIIGIDQHGSIYVIETKLYRNSDKRKVMAQILDYGASIWKGYPGEETFIGLLDHHVRICMGESLQERIMRSYGFDPDRAGLLMTAVAAAAVEGRFRFIILMDRLHDHLKNMIAFINANSSFAVYGVEFDFYRHDDLEILIPRLYGAEIIRQSATPDRRQWDYDSFLDEAGKSLPPAQLLLLRTLADWALAHADSPGWGKGGEAYMNPKFSSCHPSRSLFSLTQRGVIYLTCKGMAPDEHALGVVRRIGERLRGIGELQIPEDFMNKNPPLNISQWGPYLPEIITIFGEELNLDRG